MDANNRKLLELLGGDEPRPVRPHTRARITGPRKGAAQEAGVAASGGPANTREVLTCGQGGELVPTTDPFDRAHKQRDAVGLCLLPACRVLGRRGDRLIVGQPLPGSRPRLYPRALMVGGPEGPVSIDSAFDQAYERAVRLSEELGDVAGAGSFVASGQRFAAARAAGMRSLEQRVGAAEASRLVRATRSRW